MFIKINHMKNLFIANLVIINCLILYSCQSKSDKNVNKVVEVLPENIVELSSDQFKQADIRFDTIKHRDISSNLKVNGIITVLPQNLASVCAPLGGYIKSANLMQGSPVKKGQQLAIIENTEFIQLQQDYLESISHLEFVEGEYNRHTELFKEDVYSAQTLQEATANYKSLKTKINALAQRLAIIGIDASTLKDENITRSVAVSSPIDGFIKSVNINTGKYVTPNDVLFEVVNTDNMILELTVFERDISKIFKGQKLNFAIPGKEQTLYEAVISQVGKTIENDKTIKVYANITKSSGYALPGMYITAWIEIERNNETAVPSEAIVQFDEKDYIFVFELDKKENGKPFTEFKILNIIRGLTDGNFTQIILPEDLNAKMLKVVIKGAYTLMAAKKNAGDMAC
jgi:cobalt-zinc-cadmium efflux system membrane fusion protein